MNDTQSLIGKLVGESEQRDAIHIAVAPVVAGQKLKAGMHVSLIDGEAVAGGVTVGIVDPYLGVDVPKGGRFWLFMYPNTITGLRHDWTHPAFKAEVSRNRSVSEIWMRKWAVAHMGYDYYGDNDSVREDTAYAYAIQSGHSEHIGPYESARDSMDEKWWAHWQNITGSKKEKPEYFSCGC